MGLMDFTASTKLEQIGRQVLLNLAANVNTEIGNQATIWAPRDVEYAQKMEITYTPIDLEPIPKANMHYGHIPSLVDAPVGEYPNVSVLAPEVSEMGSDDQGWDQFGVDYDVNLYVEIMAKSLYSEEEVNSRIQRTTDAVNIVVMRDHRVGGLTTEIKFVSVGISDVFKRKELQVQGADWYWQGSRIDYTLKVPGNYVGS